MNALLVAVTLSAAPAPAATKLDWKDFWDIAGVTRDSKKEDVLAKWGKPDDDKGKTLRWKLGPSVDFRDDGALQLDFGSWAAPFVEKHPAANLSVLGMSCEAAGKKLAFTGGKKIASYTTCKHYDASGWLLDVTMMCTGGKVSTLVVVWVPVPELKTMSPLPEDHC